MAGIEFLLIDRDTRVSDLKKEVRWNDIYYALRESA
jgi:L-arabinose isomerase